MNNKPVIEKLEDIKYFKQIVKGHTTKEIIDLFYKTTGILLSKQQVKDQKRRFKLTSGVDAGFKKGHKATGKPFKKGNIPHNHKPIGYEFLRSDGYIEIKVAEPNTWKLKHLYIYEKYKGKIPEGYNIIFLDQDKTNFNLDNLELVKTNIIKGTIGTRLIIKNKEFNKALILTQQLKEKVKEKVKQG